MNTSLTNFPGLFYQSDVGRTVMVNGQAFVIERVESQTTVRLRRDARWWVYALSYLKEWWSETDYVESP